MYFNIFVLLTEFFPFLWGWGAADAVNKEREWGDIVKLYGLQLRKRGLQRKQTFALKNEQHVTKKTFL